MQKETLNNLLSEVKVVAVIGLFLLIGMKVVMYRDSLFTLLKLAAALMWMFVIPGFVLMSFSYRWLSLPIRLGLGTCLGFASYGIMSYYLGVFGLHVRFHWKIIPLLLVGLGILMLFYAERNYQERINVRNGENATSK